MFLRKRARVLLLSVDDSAGFFFALVVENVARHTINSNNEYTTSVELCSTLRYMLTAIAKAIYNFIFLLSAFVKNVFELLYFIRTIAFPP